MLLQQKKLSLLVPAISALGMMTAAPLALSQSDDSVELLEEEVIITGFRAAQAAALDQKRNSANSVESIIAEDIGKMPDLNLAESLQRSPGVAITREGGEGRQITVRGLGPTYSRVTLNGMEVPASTGGLDSSGGVNRGRSFDFNIFSSDLFRQININKNAVAHIEEGGLASTVELYTMRPLDNPGFSANGSVQGAYNYHTGASNPRLTGLISNSFMDDTVGVLFGFNYNTRTVNQEGFGTVRWTGPASNFRGDDPSGHGWADTSQTDIIGNPRPDLNYDVDAVLEDSPNLTPLDFMWAPRLPRMDSFNQEQERTGVLLAVQARPSDELELSLNVLSATRDSDVTSYNYFAQFRNTHNSITPTRVTIDPTGRYIIAGTFQNVTPRSESRGQFSSSDFQQVVANASYDFSDNLRLDVMLGNANSTYDEEQYRYNLTANEGHEFSYSFLADSDVAEMTYGFDILDPSEYGFTGPTHRQSSLERDNTTFKVDLTWVFDDSGSNLMAGLIMNDREVTSIFSDVPAGLTDPNSPNANNTALLSQLVDQYGDGIGGPSGFPTDWLVADFNVVRREYNAGRWAPDLGDSRNFSVTEETLGVYVEVNYQATEALLVNAGLRQVETELQTGASYSHTLPAINLTYEAVQDVLLRAAYSKNISRPNPSQLNSAVAYTPINGNLTINNPNLEPEEADSFDVSAEWYFAEESFLGIAYFQKEITNSIESETEDDSTLSEEIASYVEQDPVYDPNSPAFEEESIGARDINAWNVTTLFNGGQPFEVSGIEIGFNYVMPIGVGFLANITQLDTDDDIVGLSKNSWNLGAFYENDLLGARLVVNGRDDYITDFTGSNGNAEHGTTGPVRVDFSGSYSLNDNIDFTLEIINLTNEKERLYTTGPQGGLDLVREYNTTGTELIFGVRASF